jgi:hypothetical protein
VDLTLFPNELSAVAPLLQLIDERATPEEVRSAAVSSLGDFVTHFAPDPVKAKQYIQELNGGPISLIALLEDPRSKAKTRGAAAGALWAIMDTSKISTHPDLLSRLINATCLLWHHLLIQEEDYQSRLAEHGAQSDANAATAFEEKMIAEDLRGPGGRRLRADFVYVLAGLLWNMTIVEDCRRMMAANSFFFPALFTILQVRDHSKSHFACLHLVATLHHYGYLSGYMMRSFVCHLKGYIASKDAANSLSGATEVGRMLSLRDVVAFFLPLLRSKKPACVLFGKWCTELFYFKRLV